MLVLGKGRFMKNARFVSLVMSVFLVTTLLIGCTGKGGTTAPSLTNLTPTLIPSTTTTEKVDVSLHSIYDGTYSGMFNYEYQKRSNLDENWSQETGVWIPSAFMLTLTFKTAEVTAEYISLEITNVICSDQNFGTGLSGVTPVTDSDTWVYLPAIIPTAPLNPSKAYMGINIKFLNYALLQAPTLTLSGDASQGFLSVSSDGRVLSNSLDPAIQDWTWLASTPSGIFLTPSGWGYYLFQFKSWTLTKF
jgi:hypothetical protein